MQAAAQLRFGRPSQNLGLTQELLKQFVAGAFLPAARQPVLASHMGTTGTHRHEGRKQGHVLTPAQLHKSVRDSTHYLISCKPTRLCLAHWQLQSDVLLPHQNMSGLLSMHLLS